MCDYGKKGCPERTKPNSSLDVRPGTTDIVSGCEQCKPTDRAGSSKKVDKAPEWAKKTRYRKLANDIADQNPWSDAEDRARFIESFAAHGLKEDDNVKGISADGRRLPWKQENYDEILRRTRKELGPKLIPENFKSLTVGESGYRKGFSIRPVKVINPNNYPTLTTYPPGYDSPGSSNPPNTPPITRSPGDSNHPRTPPIMNSPSLSESRLSLNDDQHYYALNPTTHGWVLGRQDNDDLYADPSPMPSRGQSPAPRSDGSSPHVANQSPTSRGTRNARRSRATSGTSSKGSSDSNTFENSLFDFAAASTHTPPRSTGAPQPVPASHAQHVSPSTYTTVGKAPATAGKTPASWKTVGASKRPTESSASSSKAKGDKDKNSLKSSASSSGRKEDKGKGPTKKS
ncbi:hypothetical protein GT037_002643 [Alternaria burnsii]|uniref:Uncharacterized protein n=1 Tax=Alternaria burnsii TaxID=1187904 RepID=A0A8H7EHH6_9PLEO|nr:uncharacterized protein GT037_002643 [Alternaria burnsii]KAF7678895.1 hypothetical protein GT037_002643 [Alternaria burnsii]